MRLMNTLRNEDIPATKQSETTPCAFYGLFMIVFIYVPQRSNFIPPLQWRHNERHGVSNHQHLDWINQSTVCPGAHKKYQSSAPLAFVRGIHWWAVDSPHKWPVTRKRFPVDDVIRTFPPLTIAGFTPNPWLRHDKETLSKLLALYEGNH